MKRIDQVFGEHARVYLPFLEEVHAFLSANTFRYGFVVPDVYAELAKDNPALAMQIYWQEMLMMTHMAATTSLLRSHAWLSGTCQAIDGGNALAFAGCFRGFLEGTSDTCDALVNVPLTLIVNRQLIIQNLAKAVGPALINKEIEDQLIHFLRARELPRGDDAPGTHRKKQAAEYFASVDKSRSGPVRELYRELCDLSHPSEASVFLFLDQMPDGYQVLNPQGAPDFAKRVVANHRGAVETAFEIGINIPILALKVLNEFPLKWLHTPPLEARFLDSLELGRMIRKRLGRERW